MNSVTNIDTIERNNSSMFNAYNNLIEIAGSELAEGTIEMKELKNRM